MGVLEMVSGKENRMGVPDVTYSPSCVVCADPASGPTAAVRATCDRDCVEGVVRRVEWREHAGPHGRYRTVRLQLRTADGPCAIGLGARFSYLGDGLAEAPEGVVVRAYHLRRARTSGVPVDAAPRLASAAFRSAAQFELAPARAATSPTIPLFLSDAETVVVLEPDWLVDVTSLSGTDYCLRQWLANRLAAQPATLQKLRGTLVHTVFRGLQDGTLDDEHLRAAAHRHALDLALLGIDEPALVEAAAPHLERLRQWRDLFGAQVFSPALDPCYETTLLCPELGLRGRVDLTLRRTGAAGLPLVSLVVELKTARYNEHWPDPEFQVRGYYAMLASQGRLAPDFQAQVLYTGSQAVNFRTISCGPEHVQDVLSRRNQAVLALLLGHAPPSTSNRCRNSASRPDCVQLSRLLGLDHCQGRDLADAAAGDGDPEDATFYADHYRLLRLEQQATGRQLAALWRSTAAERDAAGTAILVDGVSSVERCDDGRWRYRLRCRNRSELRPGETVLLSDGDAVRGDVAVGTLLSSGAEMVEIAAMESVAHPQLIDRYESGEVLDRVVRSLHAWLRAPAALRRLIYGTRAPMPAPPLDPGDGGTTRALRAGLNTRQTDAFDLALRTGDYALIQGPPGTGKTYLIARIVRALVARGDRVLLSAWTNQAVDTLLHALLSQGFDGFVRLGSARHAEGILAAHRLDVDGGTPAALAERLRTIPVLAGTVSTLADARYNAAHLARDVAILDEAAQLSLSASVGALRLARRFILVGDDQQLPPVVQSDEAARDGLSLSPFAHLRPEAQAAGALVTLSEQYRMHEAIAAWPSAAFYGGQLRAHESAAARLLPPTGSVVGASALIDRERPVVLIDCGGDPAREAEQAMAAVIALIDRGVPAAQIGVVAPFRHRVAAVRRLLESDGRASPCTVDTVDRFQGGQREAMVVCLGVDGVGRRGHAFVDDPRRLNVAFTRARAKLIVIGGLSQAATLPTLAGFLHFCHEHGVPVIRAYGQD